MVCRSWANGLQRPVSSSAHADGSGRANVTSRIEPRDQRLEQERWGDVVGPANGRGQPWSWMKSDSGATPVPGKNP
jgi:hypothetical protein